MNNTTPPHVQFIKKPAYAAMGLLSLLGDECIEEEMETSDPRITALATRSGKSIGLAIVYANDTVENKEDVKTVSAVIKNIRSFDSAYVVYLLNNIDTNPFLLWRNAGSPVFPSAELRRRMRQTEVSQTIFCQN